MRFLFVPGEWRGGGAAGILALVRQLVDDHIEPLALDELHGVKDDVAILSHLEDRDDVRMVQPRRGPRFTAKSLLPIVVLGDTAGHDFERHAAAERDLLGLVDHPHAAAPHLADHPVVAYLPQRRCWGRVRAASRALKRLFSLLHLDERGEELADFVAHLRATLDILL